MDPGLCDLLEDFYTDQRRWVEADGLTANGEPITPMVSLLQGCPFSVILLTALTVCWVMEAKKHEVNTAICVDDRALWALGDDGAQRIQNAMEAGSRIDTIFRWQLHPDKLSSFSTTPRGVAQLAKRRKTLGTCQKKFKLLGIYYTMSKRTVVPDVTRMEEKILPRLRRISRLTSGAARRKFHTQRLVLPAIAWQGTWTRPAATKLCRWRRKIELAVIGYNRTGRSRGLAWAIEIGADLDPAFRLDLAALQHATWIAGYVARRPERVQRRRDRVARYAIRQPQRRRFRKRISKVLRTAGAAQRRPKSDAKKLSCKARQRSLDLNTHPGNTRFYGLADQRYGYWRTSDCRHSERLPRLVDAASSTTALHMQTSKERLLQTCRRFGWELQAGGSIMAEGVQIVFGRTSKKTIKALATRAWQRAVLSTDPRADDEESRAALQSAHPSLQAHTNAFIDQSSLQLRSYARGCLRDGHTWTRIQQQDVAATPAGRKGWKREKSFTEVTSTRCMCDLPYPNSRHWAWHCPATVQARSSLELLNPRCGAEEAYCLEFDPFPTAPPNSYRAEDVSRIIDEISFALTQQQTKQDGLVLVASDGGA